MKINKCTCLYFSPTGTTEKVINKISEGIKIQEKEIINFTKQSKTIKDRKVFKSNELVIIGVPVYSGRIPIQTVKYINKIKAEQTPTVIVVVYGNREYEDALIELKDSCERVGFKILAGAVFIGEHTLSSKKKPIAQGRPDDKDLNKAFDFGKDLKEKIEKINKIDNIKNVSVPGNLEYKKRQWMPKISPITNYKLCTLCSKCISVCPTDAIKKDNNRIITNKNACIPCYACIKVCPVEAREMKNVLFKLVGNKLYKTCKERKEPELYL